MSLSFSSDTFLPCLSTAETDLKAEIGFWMLAPVLDSLETVLNGAAFGVTVSFFFVTGFKLLASFSTDGITFVGLATNLSWLSWSTGILGMEAAGLSSLSDLGRLGLVLIGAVTVGRELGEGVRETGIASPWVTGSLVTLECYDHERNIM